eukprot:4178397-Prymnesium_polylepis.1
MEALLSAMVARAGRAAILATLLGYDEALRDVPREMLSRSRSDDVVEALIGLAAQDDLDESGRRAALQIVAGARESMLSHGAVSTLVQLAAQDDQDLDCRVDALVILAGAKGTDLTAHVTQLVPLLLIDDLRDAAFKVLEQKEMVTCAVEALIELATDEDDDDDGREAALELLAKARHNVLSAYVSQL